MRLVVNNPNQVPVKHTEKLQRASGLLAQEMNSGDLTKAEAVPGFEWFFEAHAPASGGNSERSAVENQIEEHSSAEAPAHCDLPPVPFEKLIDGIGRRYEEILSNASFSSLPRPHVPAPQGVKFIDARAHFENIRRSPEGANPSDQRRSPSHALHPSPASLLDSDDGWLPRNILNFPSEGQGNTGQQESNARIQAPLAADLSASDIEPQVENGKLHGPMFSRAATEKVESREPVTSARTVIVDAGAAQSASPPEEVIPRVASALPLVPSQSPMQQVIGRVVRMLSAEAVEYRHMTSGQSIVRFALNPENLGDVSIVMRMRDRSVDLSIRPMRTETAIYLEAARDELMLSLKLAGTDVGSVDIRVMDLAANQETRQDRPGSGWSGGNMNAFQSQQGGGMFHGGARENQSRTLGVATTRNGNEEEADQTGADGVAIGRGIVL
jgi:hypothetical protein